MSRVVIKVGPIQGGWAVSSPFSSYHLMFLSGAKAEAKGRELGRMAAALGADAEVQIHDRQEALIASHVCLAAASAAKPTGEARVVRRRLSVVSPRRASRDPGDGPKAVSLGEGRGGTGARTRTPLDKGSLL